MVEPWNRVLCPLKHLKLGALPDIVSTTRNDARHSCVRRHDTTYKGTHWNDESFASVCYPQQELDLPFHHKDPMNRQPPNSRKSELGVERKVMYPDLHPLDVRFVRAIDVYEIR